MRRQSTSILILPINAIIGILGTIYRSSMIAGVFLFIVLTLTWPVRAKEPLVLTDSQGEYPLASRDVFHQNFIFNVSLPLQTEQTIYLRFENEATMRLPLTLWSPEALGQEIYAEPFRHGLFFGVLLIMLVYNLSLFISVRDKAYLYYSLFLLSLIMAALAVLGLRQSYLHYNPSGWSRFATVFFVPLTSIAALQFTGAFLMTKAYTPRLHKIILALQIGQVIPIILIPFVLRSFVVGSELSLMLLSCLVSLIAGLRVWQQGYRPARNFLLAWLGFIGLGVLEVLARWGLIPPSLIAQEGIRMGVVLLILLWALAIADRVNLLKADTEQANRGLRESEQRFRSLVEGSIQGIIVHRQTKPLFVNQAYATILGYNLPDEIMAMESVVPLIAPYEQERLLGYHAARIKGAVAPAQYEYDAVRKDGSTVTLQQLVTMIPWDGEPAVLGAIIDITQHKQARVALQRSNDLLEATQSIAHVGSWEYYPETQFGAWSAEMYRIYEIDPQLGSPSQETFLALVHPEDRQRVIQSQKHTLKTQTPGEIEFRVRLPGGKIKFVFARTLFIYDDEGGQPKLVGSIQDITERKLVEKALQESELYYRTLTESLTDYVVHLDSEGRIQYINRLAEGYTMDMVQGRHINDFLTPEYHEITRQSLKTVLETGQPATFEAFGQRTSATQGWYFTRFVPLLTGPTITDVLLIATDITKYKQAQEALKTSEARNRALLNAMPDLIFRVSEDGVILDFVPATDFETFVPPEAFLGKKLIETLPPQVAELGMKYIKQTLQTGQIQLFEYSLLIQGETRYYEARDVTSGAHEVLAIVRDVTDRKQAEEELRRSEGRLRQAQHLARIGIWEWDRASDETIWSEEMFPMYGIEPQAFTGKGEDYLNFTHPDDRQIQRDNMQASFAKAIKHHAETGQTSIIEPDPKEFRIVRPDGSICYVRGDAVAIVDEQGHPAEMLGILMDITAEKEREEALRFQKMLLECQSEASPDGILIVSKKRKWLSFNRRFVEMWAIPDEVAARRAIDIALQTVLDQLVEPEQFLTEIEYLYEHPTEPSHDEIALKDGRVFERHSSPINDDKGVHCGRVWYCRDITERIRAEENLRHRNRDLMLLNQIIVAAAAAKEPDAVLSTACRELALAFDLPQVIAVLLNNEKTVAEVVAEYKTEGRPSSLKLVISVAENPATHYLLSRAAPLVIENAPTNPYVAPLYDLIRQQDIVSLLILPLIINGEVIGTLNLIATEPRSFSTEEINLAWRVADQVAIALARVWLDQERRRLSAAIEQAAESVVIADVAGDILYVNPAFERTTGYSRTEVFGRNPRILKSNRHDAAFYEQMWATLTTGQTWKGHLVNKKKDGAFYTEEATISPVLDEKGSIVNYVALKRDVTRELQLEEQLRQAQKMEAVGRLAGGIAHDFNNLLTVLMGNAALALDVLPPDHPVYSDIQVIERSARRAADLTRQLLAFARQQISHPQILDLNELILGIEEMLHRLIRADIELVTALAPDRGCVRADMGQLEQILVNLVVNARDAMPNGGKLTLETADVVVNEDNVRHHPEVPPGEYVLLAVTDTGIGMTESVKAHLFEPFFTTKEVGQGTGLGLATCFGLVKQNDGYILVDSEPGQGASFKIFLPRMETGETT
ncbi:MAG: PAS domain S-box protein [Anaerolineaceae bacterium]|nr:PAS domain S-box protein [Anaerolineaceae bacterium]